MRGKQQKQNSRTSEARPERRQKMSGSKKVAMADDGGVPERVFEG